MARKPKPAASADLSADQIMRQYDKESATRVWTGIPARIIHYVMSVFSIYCIWSTLFSTADIPVRASAFLGLIILMGYLTSPAAKGSLRPNHLPWYDIVIMAAGAACFFYYCLNYNNMVMVVTSASKLTPILILMGILGILALAELCRRCVGIPILCVAGVLLIYTFINLMVQSDRTFGQVLARVVYTLFFSTSGVMATPLQVCLKFIAVFIIFGAFLERTGIAAFFIDLANCAAGSSSGGPAKVAVISSALGGMVSGSAVGHTVTTGSVTIPMMKKTGYKPEFSGAVEAAASTGGQIMPPIMGAAAFLMAEYIGKRYGQVALWAILPAVLYFAGIFMSVHLEAKKLGLEGIPREQLPKFRLLIRSIYLLLPLVVLVWLVSTNTRTLQFSASIAILLSILVSIPALFMDGRREAKETGRSVPLCAGKKLGGMVFNSLEAGGRSCITVAVACSMAGIIAGCITVTGLASVLINGVISVARSIPSPFLGTLIALFLTMLCCIVLGMGVPTTATYCIMASTCAPILIQLGVDQVASHFFVFYFGIVADITPPVALAAYAGSAIAKSDPMRTGVNATKLAIAGFIIPYIFALEPSLLLMDKGILSAALNIATAAIGMFGVAMGLEGFFRGSLAWPLRILAVAGGLLLFYPGILTDVIGVVIVGAVTVLQIVKYKSGNKPAPAG